MPQLVSCPHCQRQLNVPDNLLGKNVKCPSCQNTFTATAGGAGGGAESAAETPRRSASGEGAAGAGASGGTRPHRGVLILILGIASILVNCCGFTFWIAWITGGIGLWLGGADLKAMDRGEMDPAGRGMTKIGWICSIVGLVLSVLLLCGGCIYGGISAFSGSGK
jgi:predicted Zn finger-like uncharacterized protein